MMIPARDPPVDGPGVSPCGAKTVVFRGGFGAQRNSPRINELRRQDQFVEGPKIHKTSLMTEDLGVLYLQTPMTYDVVEAAVALRLARSEGIETRAAGGQDQIGRRVALRLARSEGIETGNRGRVVLHTSMSRYALPAPRALKHCTALWNLLVVDQSRYALPAPRALKPLDNPTAKSLLGPVALRLARSEGIET